MIARLVVGLALAATIAGCGAFRPRPWNGSAQVALNATAHAIALTDQIAAHEYERQAADVQSHVDLDRLDVRFVSTLSALRIARQSLLIAEAAVNSFERTHDTADQCRARTSLFNAIKDTQSLVTLLPRIGVMVPGEIQVAIDALERVAANLTAGCSPSTDAGAP